MLDSPNNLIHTSTHFLKIGCFSKAEEKLHSRPNFSWPSNQDRLIPASSTLWSAWYSFGVSKNSGHDTGEEVFQQA
jgi:hypothetical protein